MSPELYINAALVYPARTAVDARTEDAVFPGSPYRGAIDVLAWSCATEMHRREYGLPRPESTLPMVLTD